MTRKPIKLLASLDAESADLALCRAAATRPVRGRCVTPGGSGSVVEILLSTYNGARHLDAFLQSLADQSHQEWTLTVRDDGSFDDTKEMLSHWRKQRPQQIHIVDCGPPGNVGVVRSFSWLLNASAARYVMMADQDDVWLPTKIELTLGAMLRREAKLGPERPILVHTDLRVVDEHLELLSKSLWAFQGLAPGKAPILPRLMIENVVWGCTAMLNRPLIQKVGEIPGDLAHHDWWIALVAAAFGDLVSLPDTPILWRRHGLNGSDVSSVRELPIAALKGMGSARDRLDAVLKDARRRISVFLDRYRDELAANQIGAAEALLALPDRGFILKRWDLLRHGFLFGSPVRSAGLLALI